MFVEKKRGIDDYGPYKKDNYSTHSMSLIKFLKEKGSVQGKVLNYEKGGSLELNILGRTFILDDIKENFQIGEMLTLTLAKNSINIKRNHIEHTETESSNFLFTLENINQAELAGLHVKQHVADECSLKLAEYFLKLLYRPQDYDAARRLAFLIAIESSHLDLISQQLNQRITQTEIDTLKSTLELASAQFSDEEMHAELFKCSFKLSQILISAYKQHFGLKPLREEFSIADKVYKILQYGAVQVNSRIENNFNNIFQSDYRIVPFFHMIGMECKHCALFIPKNSKRKPFLKSNLFDTNTVISIILDDLGITFLCDIDIMDLAQCTIPAPNTMVPVRFMSKE